MPTQPTETETELNGDRPLINVSEAAAYLGVSAASLRKWSDDGLVASYRTPGGQRRFSHADLEQFKASMRRPSREQPHPTRNEPVTAVGQTRRRSH